jgi:flagellar biosynthesis protein FliQ
MTSELVIQIGRELLYTALLLALPTVAASLIVGLVISILQTITSIQEQTLTFAPRIIAVGLVLVLTLPWTLQVLMQFTQRMFWLMAETTR